MYVLTLLVPYLWLCSHFYLPATHDFPFFFSLRDYSIYGMAKLFQHTIEHSKLFSPVFAGGASYSPEYYINIRTGIHYFPKGNATVDPGSNRFKSGLNRIEEKNDEVIVTAFQLFAILLYCLSPLPAVESF